MHANPDNCAQFYQCAEGHQFPMQNCPEGLLYNAEEEYCDWPDNVDCKVSKWDCWKDCVGDKWWNPMHNAKCANRCFPVKEEGQYDMFKGFSGNVEKKSCEEGIYANPLRYSHEYLINALGGSNDTGRLELCYAEIHMFFRGAFYF